MYLVDNGVVFQISGDEFQSLSDDEKYDPLKDRVEEEVSKSLMKLFPVCISEEEFELRARKACAEGEVLSARIDIIKSIWSDLKQSMSKEALNERYRVDIEPETLAENHVHNEEGGAFNLDTEDHIPCLPCERAMNQYLERIDALKNGQETGEDDPQIDELFKNIVSQGLGDEVNNLQEGDLLVIEEDGSIKRISAGSQEYEDRMNLIRLMATDPKDMGKA